MQVRTRKSIGFQMVNNDSLLVQQLGDVAGHDDQTGTGIDRSAGPLQLELFLAKRDLLQLDLPVSLPPERDVIHLALKRVLVDASKNALATVLFRRSEPEGEDGLVQQLLVDHVVERRGDLVDGDVVVRQSEDTVKLAKGESETGFLGGLSEQLVLDDQVGDTEVVTRDETFNATGSVLDGELGPVRLVRLGGGRVVLGVKLRESTSRYRQ
jgi:hypothetical protein